MIKTLLNIFNRSILLYLLIWVIFHFTTDLTITQNQRLLYLRVCVHDNFGRINDKTYIVYLDFLTHMKPDHAPSWVRLGVSQFNLGEWERAAASYRKALALDPTNPKYQLDLHNIELLIKNKKK